MIKKLKIGFIGGGINSAVGNTHKIASQMDDRWKPVVGCFSRNNKINIESGEIWRVKNTYSNWITLLEKEKDNIDVISILSPTNVHFEMVMKAIELDIPVICEKAITNSYKTSEMIFNYANKKRNFLTVINNYTGYPMIRELKEMIQSKKLGNIKHIQIEMPQEGFTRYMDNGVIPMPQEWRLNDHTIPTIYLDLGVHLYHIIEFLCDLKPLEIIANQSSTGFFDKIIDNVSCLVNYENNVTGELWFSKVALGNRNGLRIRIFGELGSAEWFQMDSEIIKYCDKYGKIEIIDRASPNMKIANLSRYNRFKSGHPAGFIEAFANYYTDIADALIEYKTSFKFNEKFIVSAKSARDGMIFLEKMSLSAKNKKWLKI